MGYRIQKKTKIDCLTHEDRNSVRIGTEPGASSSGSRHLRGSLLSSRWNRRNDGFLFWGFKFLILIAFRKKTCGFKMVQSLDFQLHVDSILRFSVKLWVQMLFDHCEKPQSTGSSSCTLMKLAVWIHIWKGIHFLCENHVASNFAGAWAPGGIGIRHRWNIENHGPGCHLRAMENPWKKPAEIYGKAWDPRL